MTEPRRGARAGDHSLTQGLKGDATYLVVNDRGALENFGINGAPARFLFMFGFSLVGHGVLSSLPWGHPGEEAVSLEMQWTSPGGEAVSFQMRCCGC